MNIAKVKGLVSTILIVAALLSFATGAILYFMKYGMWLIFTRKFLLDTHAISALIMGLGVVVHFTLNRRIYKMEMKTLFYSRKINKTKCKDQKH